MLSFLQLYMRMFKNEHEGMNSWARWCRKLTRGSVICLFFLTPLALAPFTNEALEINKQIVMVVLIFMAAGGWLGAAVAERSFAMRGGRLVNGVPVIYLGITFVSTLLSVAGRESWLGYGGQAYGSFLTVLAGTVLFYVLVNVSDTRLVRQSLLALMMSAGIIGLLTLLSLFNIHVLPFAFTHTIGFNTVGNINAFTAWLIPVTMVGLGFYLTDGTPECRVLPGGRWRGFYRALIGFLTVMTLLLLVTIDFWALWCVFGFGLAILVCLLLWSPPPGLVRRRLVVPCLLLATAGLFMLIKTPINLKVPVVVSPSMTTSWSIAYQTLQQNLVRTLFGSGPGSYDLDYARYRPVEINNTIFWNTRFDRAQIHPLTVLTTAGVIGFMAWIFCVFMFAAIGLKNLHRSRQAPTWPIDYVLVVGFMSVLGLLLLTPVNMSITVLFWCLGGLVVSGAASQTRKLNFTAAPRTAMVMTGGFTLFVAMGCLVVFTLMSSYSAEIAFAKAARLNAEGANPEQLIEQMVKAVARHDANAVLERNLATAYLSLAGQVVGESLADKDFSHEDKQRLVAVADAAVRAAARAAVLGEHDSANWAINGLIYRELMPFIQNAENYAASMYAKALELEPNNPAYQTDFGRVYLAVADRAQDLQERDDLDNQAMATAVANEVENLRLAVENLERAVQLKPDYAPAHYYLAATYERQGRLDETALHLAGLTKTQPRDLGLSFQLGIIYLKQKNLDAAEAEFERALKLYPDYSNAMWYLAAIKANNNDSQAALELLRRILVLNPDNQAVKDSILNLETGGTSSADPGPIDASLPTEALVPAATLPVL